jgi:hypothetical protein
MPAHIITSTVFAGARPSPDATSLVKGKLRLTGPLGGTADAPLVFGFDSIADLEEWIIGLIEIYGGGTGPSDPVTFMAPGYVAEGYVL